MWVSHRIYQIAFTLKKKYNKYQWQMQQQVAGGNIWCQTQKSSYVLSDLPNRTTYVTSENICVEEITRIKSEHFQGVQEISPRLRHNSTLLRAATSDSGDFDHSGSRSRRLPPRCTVTGLPASREDIEMAFHDIRARTLDGQVVSMEKYQLLFFNICCIWSNVNIGPGKCGNLPTLW